MSSHTDSNEPRHNVTVSASIPSADLFFRNQPAELEGFEESWRVARSVVDFGCAILSSRPPLRSDRRVRDAVLAALLRRVLVTTEAVIELLSRGLLEPALATSRTLLDLHLAFRLIERDDSDRFARRLAAAHYVLMKRHGQDMLGNKPTREGVLRGSNRIPEVIESTRSYDAFLNSETFDDGRDEVISARYWHGYNSVEEAFRAIGEESEYHMTYDSGSWFVHAANVDHDLTSISEAELSIRPLVERNPDIVQPILGFAVLRALDLISRFCKDRGLDIDEQSGGSAELVFESGERMAIPSQSALQLLAMRAFDVRTDGIGQRAT